MVNRIDREGAFRAAWPCTWLVVGAAAAGCGKFQDPNVVVDLRTLALRA